jgi:hypothetical protein
MNCAIGQIVSQVGFDMADPVAIERLRYATEECMENVFTMSARDNQLTQLQKFSHYAFRTLCASVNVCMSADATNTAGF